MTGPMTSRSRSVRGTNDAAAGHIHLGVTIIFKTAGECRPVLPVTGTAVNGFVFAGAGGGENEFY